MLKKVLRQTSVARAAAIVISACSSVCKRTLVKPIVFGGVAAVSFPVLVWSQSMPNIRPLDISSVPLHASMQGDKPALTLALSVEFPTVGAQYVHTRYAEEDTSYDPGKEYIGYYNAELCYSYIDRPSEVPAAGKTISDYKRFAIKGKAQGHKCADAFSGNFLNWASNSAIDMLRLALSGGDRIIDQPGLTILQRAVLPDGTLAPASKGDGPSCFWNSQNFPAKGLKKGADGRFSGAVPQEMVNRAVASKAETIWVANILNRIYFGLNKSGSRGSCNEVARNTGEATSATLSYTLGDPKGGVQAGSFFSPGQGTRCAGENEICRVGESTHWVYYGEASKGWIRAAAKGVVRCNNETFGKDPAVGKVKQCYAVPIKPMAGLMNSDGFFYARVEVCGKDGAGQLRDVRDYKMCGSYPDGNYKPEGTIQRYSDQLRLSAFGYAIDNTLSYQNGKKGRYGGVLRAPMKFVGQRTFDAYGVDTTPSGGNPNAEWDAVTGVFKENPDNDTSYNTSGVVNYLNKFGRLLPDRPGNYKVYDPSSELYYEALRYLQGLPPSSDAVKDLTSAMYDGFPIYKDWTELDPFAGRPKEADYSCIRNNIALIGDVNTHNSQSYDPNNNRLPFQDTARNIVDSRYWTKVVQAFESKASMSYVDGSGATQTTSNPNTASYSSPAAGDTQRSAPIIGLAYWAHTHDIRGVNWTDQPAKQRPGLRVKTFIFDVNEYALEADNTKRRTNNQYYTAAKYGGFRDQPDTDNHPYNVKGNPFYDQNGSVNNDVWQDSSRQMEPQSYFLQSDGRSVLAAFDKIFSEATYAQRSIAGAAASSGALTQTDSHVYQASYDTSGWTGDLQAFALKIGSDNVTPELGNAVWSAKQQLDTAIANGEARNIVVGKYGDNPSNPVATKFSEGTIERALQVDLDKFHPTSAQDGRWKERVAYLRGGKTHEGSGSGQFRQRSSALGDIVNSGAQYVGAPAYRTGMDKNYGSFVEANANRKPVVYIGANDGMLHAFDAKTGKEIFAYIPSWLGPKLGALTDPTYNQAGNHQAYVDASPVAGDVNVSTDADNPVWKSVLVSGTGGGGRGVFALDITDPAKFDSSKVLWEFTPRHDADMGYVLGKPRLVRMRTSAPKDETVKTRWFAMVPAGVNNYTKDPISGKFSSTGNPVIFLLALDKSPGTAWSLNNNFYKIELPFKSDLTEPINGSNQVRPTGIVNLEAFRNSDGVVEAVFAGDLHGNLWALNFAENGLSDWTASKLSRFSTGSKAYPMFIAKDASEGIQPITAAPTILRGNTQGTYFVGFGTGKYIEPKDPKSTQQNTYYVLFDDGTTKGATSGVVGIPGRDRLRKVIKDTDNKLKPDDRFFWGRATSSSGEERSGWYYDLPETGERIVYDSTYISLSTTVMFNSLIPDAATAVGICGVSGGGGNGYYVDLFSAKGDVTRSNVGIPGQPLILANDPGTTETAADSTGRRMRSRPQVAVTPGANSISARQAGTQVFPVGRLSWRQINNYQELRK